MKRQARAILDSIDTTTQLLTRIANLRICEFANFSAYGHSDRSIGVEHVIDYKSVSDLTQALRDLAPNGIDAYFDNVGGDHLDAALACARTFARFALCGMISGYNSEAASPRNLLMAIEKRLLLQGFLVTDHLSERAAFIKQMNEWLRSGDIISQQTVEHGVEQSPTAFLKLFSGENRGKMLVKL